MHAGSVVWLIRKVVPTGKLTAKAPGHCLQPLVYGTGSFQRRQVEIGERHVRTKRYRIAHRCFGPPERVDLPERVSHRAIYARGEGRLRRRYAVVRGCCANALGHGVQAVACHAHTFWRREVEISERYVFNAADGRWGSALIRNRTNGHDAKQRHQDGCSGRGVPSAKTGQG